MRSRSTREGMISDRARAVGPVAFSGASGGDRPGQVGLISMRGWAMASFSWGSGPYSVVTHHGHPVLQWCIGNVIGRLTQGPTSTPARRGRSKRSTRRRRSSWRSRAAWRPSRHARFPKSGGDLRRVRCHGEIGLKQPTIIKLTAHLSSATKSKYHVWRPTRSSGLWLSWSGKFAPNANDAPSILATDGVDGSLLRGAPALISHLLANFFQSGYSARASACLDACF